MKSSMIVKVNFLVLGLVLVLMAMHRLQKGGLNEGVTAVMGIDQTQVQSPGTRTAVVAKVAELDWCETRVKALRQPGGPEIFQEQLKWMKRETSSVRELDFIAVEKWFSGSCKLHVQPLDPQAFSEASATPVLVVQFIKGAEQTLMRDPSGAFRWKGQAFLSEEFSRALAALVGLPAATPTIPASNQ